MIEIVWVALGLGLLALMLPAKPVLRAVASLAILLAVLAVFQTTGGRGTVTVSASYVIVACVGLVGLVAFWRKSSPWLFVPLAAYLAFGMAFIWDGGAGQSGGTMNIVYIMLAWAAGAFMGSSFRDRAELDRSFTVLLVLIVVFQVLVTALQTLGVPIFELTGRSLDLEGGRANGTFTHPSTIGKVLTLVMMLLMPMTRAADATTRKLALFGLLLSIVPIALSASRANFVSALAMILVWSLLQPRDTKFFSRRFLLPALVGVVSLFFVDSILERFNKDPVGGEREHFMEVALVQFADTPWFGVGPANYVRVVGMRDALTAEGWPVHNAFMLQIVELGIIGALLFFLPLLYMFVRSVLAMRLVSRQGDYARAVVAYLPAFVLISWTGWGMLAPGMAALLFFCLAFSMQQVTSKATPVVSVSEVALVPVRGRSSLRS
ncbi:O-antigen ligase family protein [Pseudoclavibacter sp. JSM 162008]|uniref:O-antigen ligase family protein n=1 Tax=Pseudoclavibacter sp. JSM 162008 TaxID=3229855 RepID=UPI0035256F73